MSYYEIKKVLPVDNNLSLVECERILISEKICLGILDANRDIVSYVIKEDLAKALKFNIKNYSIDIISTLSDVIDIDINNINESELKKYIRLGLNKGIFVGKNRKNITDLIVNKNISDIFQDVYLFEEYEYNIPDKIKQALKLCYSAADEISLPIFLIGGVVRDIIAGKEIFDVDITVEENAIEFSKFLRKKYPGICKIKEIHEDFKTAKLIFNIDNKNIELDIASTRKEFYQYPASLPVIQEIGCSIYEDIFRRDFTINSMAMSLNQSSFCKLIDPLGGFNDLINKKIEVLHPLSYIDDPTRIIRALKFGVRFDVKPGPTTKKLELACINSGLFNNLAGERIKSEIKQTFGLNKAECLDRFINENIFFLIDKDIILPENIYSLPEKAQNIITEYKYFISSLDLIWLIYLGALVNYSSIDKIRKIISSLYLSGLETEILLGGKSILNKIELIGCAKTRFEIYELLEGYFLESVLIGLINTENPDATKNIYLYLKELQNVKIYTTGKTLIESGLSPGPVFGEILRELLQAKINNEISTFEDEKEYIKKFIPKKKKK